MERERDVQPVGVRAFHVIVAGGERICLDPLFQLAHLVCARLKFGEVVVLSKFACRNGGVAVGHDRLRIFEIAGIILSVFDLIAPEIAGFVVAALPCLLPALFHFFNCFVTCFIRKIKGGVQNLRTKVAPGFLCLLHGVLRSFDCCAGLLQRFFQLIQRCGIGVAFLPDDLALPAEACGIAAVDAVQIGFRTARARLGGFQRVRSLIVGIKPCLVLLADRGDLR